MITIVHGHDYLGRYVMAKGTDRDCAYLCGIRKPRYPVPVTKDTNDYYWRCRSILWYLAHFGRSMEWRQI